MMELKVGDKVTRIVEAAANGREISRKTYTITQITKAGYIYAKPENGQSQVDKFNAPYQGRCWEWRPSNRRGFSSYRIWLENLTASAINEAGDDKS
jgi:hypothetical protein